MPGLLVDDAVELVHLGRFELCRFLQQCRGGALDGGERRAKLVAHHAKELRAQPLQFLELRQILYGHHHRPHCAVFVTDRSHVDERRDAAPVRDGDLDFLGAHHFAGPQMLGDGKLPEADLLAAGAADCDHAGQLLDRPPRGAQRLANAPRLTVNRHKTACSHIEHHDADRRSLDQRLEVGPRAPLVAVDAGVDDCRRRLAGEQHQHLLVLVGELGRCLLLGEEKTADGPHRGGA